MDTTTHKDPVCGGSITRVPFRAVYSMTLFDNHTPPLYPILI